MNDFMGLLGGQASTRTKETQLIKEIQKTNLMRIVKMTRF
jgi:hypothetical protein